MKNRYAEQYYFKRDKILLKLTDAQAKKQAYDQVVEETALFEVAKSKNLLATKAEAQKMADEIGRI